MLVFALGALSVARRHGDRRSRRHRHRRPARRARMAACAPSPASPGGDALDAAAARHDGDRAAAAAGPGARSARRDQSAPDLAPHHPGRRPLLCRLSRHAHSGPVRGVLVAALSGGMVSSTAVTVAFARRAASGEDAAVLAAGAATAGAVFARPRGRGGVADPAGAVHGTGRHRPSGAAIVFLLPAVSHSSSPAAARPRAALALGNPFELGTGDRLRAARCAAIGARSPPSSTSASAAAGLYPLGMDLGPRRCRRLLGRRRRGLAGGRGRHPRRRRPRSCSASPSTRSPAPPMAPRWPAAASPGGSAS